MGLFAKMSCPRIKKEKDSPVATVATTPPPHQRRGGVSLDTALLIGLVVVTVIPIAALLWIVLASGQNMGDVAQVAIGAISAVAVASISAITVAIRKRRTRTGRS